MDNIALSLKKQQSCKSYSHALVTAGHPSVRTPNHSVLVFTPFVGSLIKVSAA